MVSIRLAGITLERAGRSIVRHAHLTIAAGELVVVTGARGSGKSLLLAAAAGVIAPQEGTIEVAGRALGPVGNRSRRHVRRNIGYLPSDPPFSREETALENVVLALAVRGFAPAEAELCARRSLTEVGADDWADRTVADLSPGERRLVAIARALCGPPPIVVLDEPTAGLGRWDLERLARAFDNARAAGAALLCASNDAGLLDALADSGVRHVRLSDGVLVGAHGSLRVVDDDDTPTEDVSEADHPGAIGGDLADHAIHPAREVS